ncbi:hypothetical protein FMEXI_9744 [Fusarium mexicanum]|uniref:Uncharacterized protein n=1 Tax=Fusarium mexicanum TaxID=751941 RepID=A0A8H5IKV6_9HYPO|nr:hypothetical protein FMEXI_9744 [Fusarium mexicanum]
MEEHHVYHHHHYHYHYHYTYPFPAGPPPNFPPSNEPPNQEAAGHDNEEPWIEDDDDDDDEEHTESGDAEDQHNLENGPPNPVQEETRFTVHERSGFVVFDDSFGILNLDTLSPEAHARFTNTQSSNDNHEEGPPRKRARACNRPEQPSAQIESHPRQSGNITIIDKARIISTDGSFRVVNCDPAGPQVNIRWRVPGQRNIWLFRFHTSSPERSLNEVLELLQAEAPDDMTFSNTFAAREDEETVSLIIGSRGKHDHNRFERDSWGSRSWKVEEMWIGLRKKAGWNGMSMNASMEIHHHLHEHRHDADQPDTPTIRGRPRHSDDDTPEVDDEPRTEETVVNIVDELPRSGLVIFDDCVSLVHVNTLPERALNRWREEEQRHQQNPQETQPQRSHIPPSIYDGSAPVLSSRNLTQVSRACIIASNGFYVVNCDTAGPQVNICWRVPGPRNIWLARLAASPDGSDTGNSPSIIPGMTLSAYMRIFNIKNPYLATMDPMHRDRYRVTETQPHGKGEKMRTQASGIASDAQHQPQAPSKDDKPPSKASQGDDVENDDDHGDENHDDDDDPNLPYFRPIVQNYNLLRILPTVAISSDPTLLIQNPRADGPQSDICARVPGSFNHWAASVSCYDSFDDLWDLIVMHSGVDSPEVHFHLANFGASYTYSKGSVAQELVLDEPASIIAWTNDPDPDVDFSQLTMVGTTEVSTTPLLPYLQHVLGKKGSKWLV